MVLTNHKQTRKQTTANYNKHFMYIFLSFAIPFSLFHINTCIKPTFKLK